MGHNRVEAGGTVGERIHLRQNEGERKFIDYTAREPGAGQQRRDCLQGGIGRGAAFKDGR